MKKGKLKLIVFLSLVITIIILVLSGFYFLNKPVKKVIKPKIRGKTIIFNSCNGKESNNVVVLNPKFIVVNGDIYKILDSETEYLRDDNRISLQKTDRKQSTQVDVSFEKDKRVNATKIFVSYLGYSSPRDIIILNGFKDRQELRNHSFEKDVKW